MLGVLSGEPSKTEDVVQIPGWSRDFLTSLCPQDRELRPEEIEGKGFWKRLVSPKGWAEGGAHRVGALGVASAGPQEELGSRRRLQEMEEMETTLDREGLTRPPAVNPQISARQVEGPFYIWSFSKHLPGAHHVPSPVWGELGNAANWTDGAHVLWKQMSMSQL